jgi:uncharacterized protein YtpQ (UPF0354 family)
MTRRGLAIAAASVTLAGVVAPRAFAADGLASGEFRDEVVEVLRRLRPALRLELPADPTTIAIDPVRIYLGNLYQDCAGATRKEREERILRFVDAMASTMGETGDDAFASVRSRLRPRLNSVALAANSAEEKLQVLTRPFSKNALIAYVVDSPLAMAFVSKGTFAKWSVAPEAVHTATIANLDAVSRDVAIETHAPHPGAGLYVGLQGSDGYMAARLLAPKFMARVADELGPEHFVSAPHRDLLMAWSVDCSIKKQLAALATQYAAMGARGVTDEIFVWSADGVRPADRGELADHGRG